jgi:CubicO group peptidase (beta-lactamase class C family)
VGIALVDKNGPYWIAGLGEANVTKHIKADADTMFPIASVSKNFVALAILKLVEERKEN